MSFYFYLKLDLDIIITWLDGRKQTVIFRVHSCERCICGFELLREIVFNPIFICAAIVNDYIKDNDINLAEFTSTRVASTLENAHIISVTMEGATKRYASKLKGYGSKRFMRISLPEFKKYVSF